MKQNKKRNRLKRLLRVVLYNCRVSANFNVETRDGEITEIVDKYGRKLSSEEYQCLLEYNWHWDIDIRVFRAHPDISLNRVSEYDIRTTDPCKINGLRDEVEKILNDNDLPGFKAVHVEWVARVKGGDNKSRVLT
jgi:hypothetical protein